MGGIRNLQVCARCRNHDIRMVLKGHKRICPFKQCNCEKCQVTRDRQSFIAKEIAMHRYEIKNKSELSVSCNGLKMSFVRSKSLEETRARTIDVAVTKNNLKVRKGNGEIRKEQLCSRCRNHGVYQTLRGHKNACPFTNCLCEKCSITMKRREIMAKQIKDYRNYKVSEASVGSQEIIELPKTFLPSELTSPSESSHFVDYEPIEDRDLFFMIQSLYEIYGMQNSEKKIQLIYAFAHMSKSNWTEINTALKLGENLLHELISAYKNLL